MKKTKMHETKQRVIGIEKPPLNPLVFTSNEMAPECTRLTKDWQER